MDFFLDVGHYMDGPFPEGHPNRRVHGHTFHGVWVVVGTPNEHGFVIEAGSAQTKLKSVIERYDHRMLNEIPGLENPTTEVLTQKIFDDLKAVEPRTAAVELYRPSVGLRIRYPVKEL
ncbi:MAG TPA: 6-carboxytetrahydropterin synthase [Bdellovibrionota bacterium]|jgi:6-pyruvoyltetrahydropterin/6-carboxytetrahydropterin synthase|nr:6-carboxytetrahydropterin synthase [Bdellovibrionota bacterium]